jgi:hypothetical protein
MHTNDHYFRTEDFFQTISSIEKPTAKAWDRIGIAKDELIPDVQLGTQVPQTIGHTWASACIVLGGDTILQAFTTKEENGVQYNIQSMIAVFENGKYRILHISNSWTNATGRGLYEPQIAQFKDEFFMTARAEDGYGYFVKSRDRGRTWDKPIRWRWDNGEVIPMDQTMTKLIPHSNGLILVYTRIRDDNAQTFRHRAPLHVADFDTESLALKRNTERIIVPDKGFAVGNFWVWTVSREESYVVTAEWPRDGRETNGDIWLTKVRWKVPNQYVAKDGNEVNP